MLKISGIKTLTLLDWPGRAACIVFTAGCNMRCRFCHNPEFVLPKLLEKTEKDLIPEAAVLNFLKTRQGLLEGVVVCGGEPTLHGGLPDFCRAVKALGFPVKLDTNGLRPDVVRALAGEKLIDCVAMDFKHAPAKYGQVTGVPNAEKKALETGRFVIESGLDHEFRTTVAKGEHSAEDIAEIAKALSGAKRYFLQNFRPGKTLDPEFAGLAFTPEELEALAETARAAGLAEVGVRR